jgi:replicative DNA helicase
MSDKNEPVDTIQEWQKWYKQNETNQITTEEKLTEYIKTTSMKKAQEYFADTIAEFANELTGIELYKAFYAAAQENLDLVGKEYTKAKQLVDCLKGIN